MKRRARKSKRNPLGKYHKRSRLAYRRNPDKRWTLAEIKRANERGGGHFFDRKTMKFFNDKMSNFGVRHVGGKVIVYRKKNRYQSDGNRKFVSGEGGKQYVFDPATGAVRGAGSNPRRKRRIGRN